MSEANGKVHSALEVMEAGLTRQMTTWMTVCAHCGLCNDACHYFLASREPALVPTYKTDRLRHVWRRKHEWLGQIFPRWVSAVDLTEERLAQMAEIAFRDCTLCGRCVYNCPFGVDTRQIVRTMRAMATASGNAPEILEQLADSAIAREENLEFFKDFYLEQIQEIEAEAREITGDASLTIPVSQPARVLYVPLSGKHTILPEAIIFHAARESWSLSLFEASNYGVFLHDAARYRRIAERVINEAKRLGVEEVIVTECGHAYSSYRWMVPNWFEDPLPFKVRSIVEVMDDYIREGRIQVAALDDLGAVTLHDPCNLGRNGGVYDAPRSILRRVARDYREMTPNRENNLCCGGGGGLVANLDYEEQRIRAGKPKADQIRATGAKTVVASCDNCRHQIGEIGERYELGTDVIGMAELVVRAMQKAGK